MAERERDHGERSIRSDNPLRLPGVNGAPDLASGVGREVRPSATGMEYVGPMSDWATRIREARLQGVDLTAQMSEADLAEARAEAREWLDGTPQGQAFKDRALGRIAAKRGALGEAS